MDLMQILQGQLPDGMIKQLSQQIGGDEQQTAAATNGVISTLLGALSKNAASPDGANSLANALDRDHDGSILNDIAGFLGGSAQPANDKAANGAGILNHVLGDKLGGAVDMISQVSGLNGQQAGSLMEKLAPILMGVLGATKQQQGLDSSGLASLLGGTVQTGSGDNPFLGMVTRFLDQDNDGSVIDDIANLGMKFLFKR